MTRAEARTTLEAIFAGEWEEGAIRELLAAMRDRGETVDEIVGFAEAMRAAVADIGLDGEALDCVDNCGTGGGGRHTYNISTAAALVTAGAGARVAKHGNRSSTSVCGSADVLEACGVNLGFPAERLGACLRRVGMAFLFAPLVHPAMRAVMPARRALKTRTIFNFLGPLTNPAGAQAQVIGVVEPGHRELLAAALKELGTRHSLVVYGEDGLGEFTAHARNLVSEVREGTVSAVRIEPGSLGLQKFSASELECRDTNQAAAAMRTVLAGGNVPAGLSAYRQMVKLNAAAALMAAGEEMDWAAGLERAEAALQTGAGLRTLEELARFTNSAG